MTINELVGKPAWQITGEELLFLAQHGNVSYLQINIEKSSVMQSSSSQHSILRQKQMQTYKTGVQKQSCHYMFASVFVRNQ